MKRYNTYKKTSELKKWFLQNVKMIGSAGYLGGFSVQDIIMMSEEDFHTVCNHLYPEVIPNFRRQGKRNDILTELGILD